MIVARVTATYVDTNTIPPIGGGGAGSSGYDGTWKFSGEEKKRRVSCVYQVFLLKDFDNLVSFKLASFHWCYDVTGTT